MDQLEVLKGKYASVLRLIEQKGLRLMNVHIENGKLLIRAAAGTQELKNDVWNQIKLVDPSFSDLTADIIIDSSLAPVAAAEVAPTEQSYTVQPGDSLSKIAKEFYGNASAYMKIFEANKDQLSDPDKIKVGQVLRIPA